MLQYTKLRVCLEVFRSKNGCIYCKKDSIVGNTQSIPKLCIEPVIVSFLNFKSNMCLDTA